MTYQTLPRLIPQLETKEELTEEKKTTHADPTPSTLTRMCLARKQCQQSRTSKPRFKTGTTHISSANYYLACVCTPRRSGRQRRAVRSPHLRDVALSISLDAPSGGRRGRQHTPRRRRNDLQDWITGSWSNSRSPSEQVWRVLELDHHRARARPPPIFTTSLTFSRADRMA